MKEAPKILTEREASNWKSKRRKETHLYSEEYVVRFWIQEGDFWKGKEESYYGEEKDMEEEVVRSWETENKGKKVELISVDYQ